MTSTTPGGSRDERVSDVVGATQAVAEFIVRARTAPDGATAVGRVLVDTVAVGVAGMQTEACERLLDWVLTEPAFGPATVWGTGLSLAPSQAALVNGTAAHALDWDDAVPSVPFHPGAVMIPALLARIAVTDVDGGRLVAAYNVGSAVARAISEVLPVDHHATKGWHNTSSTGRLAATAALAHLVGLDVDRTRLALGVAASMAAGSLANFGTMTKPLHAGLAARDAVMATALAERGFTANPSILEGRRGFLDMYGETGPELLASLADRLEGWESGWVTDWTLKRYPSCYATHRAIDAALTVRAGVDPTEIVEVEVSVPWSERSPLLDRRPATGLEGKFSLEYTVARALVSGHVSLADFTDEAVRDGDVGRVMDRLRILERRDGLPAPDGRHTSVTVMLEDGRELRQGVDITKGDARNPLSDTELVEKATGALTSGGRRLDVSAATIQALASAPQANDLGWLQETLRVAS